MEIRFAIGLAATLMYNNGMENEQFDSIPAAIADIANGKMVIVVDDEDRENEGDLVMAAQFCNTGSH